MTRRTWIIALLTVVTLTIAAYAHEILSYFSAYRELHSRHPFYIAESIDKVGGAAICFLAVWLIRRIGLLAISHELGLSAPLFACSWIRAICFLAYADRICDHSNLHSAY